MKSRMELTDVALSLYAFKSQVKLCHESLLALNALTDQLKNSKRKMDAREEYQCQWSGLIDRVMRTMRKVPFIQLFQFMM